MMSDAPPRIVADQSVLLVIDLQDKLLPVMRHRKTLLRRTVRLIRGAQALGVPVLHTEQYPKGLGRTVPKIARLLEDAGPAIEKTRFSACVEAVCERLEAEQRPTVIVAGIEAHVCVMQTCLDLLAREYRVVLPLDAVDSRREVDANAAYRRLIQAGVIPGTVESILFEWVGDAGAEAFRSIRDIVKDGDS